MGRVAPIFLRLAIMLKLHIIQLSKATESIESSQLIFPHPIGLKLPYVHLA